MSDEPWKKIWVKAWVFVTQGRRKLLTIPLFVAASLFILLPEANEKLQSSYKFVKSKLYPSTYLSREEYDICNEWIAVIWSYQNAEKATEELSLFKTAYSKSGHTTWKDDIFLVRSPNELNVWQIVIDMAPGASDFQTVSDRLGTLKNFGNSRNNSKSAREMRNTFGHWLDTAYVHQYDMSQFKITHGTPANIRGGCNK